MTEGPRERHGMMSGWLARALDRGKPASWLGDEQPVMMGVDLASKPDVTAWRCFHCNDVFTDPQAARLHFGREDGETPACQIKAAEGGLLKALREAEESAAELLTQLHDESGDIARLYQGMVSRNGRALITMEQLGFDRGMEAMRQEVETLRRILVDQRDRAGLVICHRPDWQQIIDEAVLFVTDNPEVPDGQR